MLVCNEQSNAPCHPVIALQPRAYTRAANSNRAILHTCAAQGMLLVLQPVNPMAQTMVIWASITPWLLVTGAEGTELGCTAAHAVHQCRTGAVHG